MGVVIQYMELEVPPEFRQFITQVILTGEFANYINSLVIKDLTAMNEQKDGTGGSTLVPSMPPTIVAADWNNEQFKQVIKEVFSSVLDEKEATGKLVRNSSGSFKMGMPAEPVFEAIVSEAVVKEVEIPKTAKGNNLFNKFKKMRGE